MQVTDQQGRVQLPKHLARFASATVDQALLYLLRRDVTHANGMLDRQAAPLEFKVAIHTLAPGRYRVVTWDTVAGTILRSDEQELGTNGGLAMPPLAGEFALAISRVT